MRKKKLIMRFADSKIIPILLAYLHFEYFVFLNCLGNLRS